MLEEFSNIIRYPDFVNFFTRFALLVDTNYNDIISYYSGKTGLLKNNAISDLNDLIKEYDKVSELILVNSNRLSINTGYWDIIESVDEVGIKLQTIKNTPKWSRSSIDLNYTDKQVVDSFLKSGQTIESMVEELGSNNFDTDWASVAINNGMYEENYTNEGEKNLKVRVSLGKDNTVTNAVDVMTGNNSLGKDIYREITFEENDIKTLIPQETLIQSAEIILEVSRGSIQEYPTLGFNKDQISTNLKSLQYPSIFRQLVEMFKQDDSFSEIEMIDTSIDQDAFFMSFSITARNGSISEQTFKIFDDTYDSTFN